VRYRSRIRGTRCRSESGFGPRVLLLRLTCRAADGPAPPFLTRSVSPPVGRETYQWAQGVGSGRLQAKTSVCGLAHQSDAMAHSR